ncbi:MAG: hypothetical protein AAF726_14490 [Planctomycetota bacterium]
MSSVPETPDDLQPVLPPEWVVLASEDSCSDERARALLGREPTEDEWMALSAARGQRRALGTLPRLAAPPALEGLVVASFEAGHRQERAARLVASLGLRGAPRDLDDCIEDLVGGRGGAETDGASVPSVLDRLVAERIDDPQRGMVRSMMGRLARIPAPSNLDTRVLAGEETKVDAAQGRRAMLRIASAAVLTSALVLGIRLVGGDAQNQAPPDVEAGPRFAVVRIDSLDDAGFSGADRALLSTLTGQVIGGRL